MVHVRHHLQSAVLVLAFFCVIGWAQEKPADIPLRWRGLIGEYVNEGETLSVLERDGDLYLQETSGLSRRLQQKSEDTFSAVEMGAFGVVSCRFDRNEDGAAKLLFVDGREYRRIAYGGTDGESFRIEPLRAPSLLRQEALRANPPNELGDFFQSDLVELVMLDSTIRLDIRYASTNNFMGEQFYSQARAFLQRPAAEALVRVHRSLIALGYGLVIHDAYRPWYVTKMFWDATPQAQKEFVADPAKGSRHNRGCAVDLSLFDPRTGRTVEMVTGYDEFSHRAAPEYTGGTSLQRWHRALLRQMMEREGFKVFESEWWHFDYRDWRKYPIGTATFEELQ